MPSLDSLTPDEQQRVVLGLTAERTAVVTGVAGSGKSLILLKKAKQVAVQTQSYAIIVYTKSLKQFFKDELQEIDQTGSHVYHYHQWLAIDNKPHYDYLFIDECQDFTAEDIDNFRQHGTYCWFFGDTDQTIMVFDNHQPQSIDDTMRQLEINRPYTLAINYRLTRENAALAEHIGRQFNDRLRLVHACVKHGPKPLLLHTDNQYKYLLDWCNDHPGEDMGILVYFNDQVIAIKDYFEQNGIPVQWKTSDTMHIDFQSTSPKIITWHCAKGLQFKHVFILYAGINDYEHYINPYISCKSSLYVACSRPLESLKVLHKTPLLDTFPQSSSDIWGISKTGKQINPFDGDLPF